MSKNINVNPGQYKVAGRERPGEVTLPEQNKARVSMERHRVEEESRRQRKNGSRKRSR